jgi:hypothetical protein
MRRAPQAALACLPRSPDSSTCGVRPNGGYVRDLQYEILTNEPGIALAPIALPVRIDLRSLRLCETWPR